LNLSKPKAKALDENRLMYKIKKKSRLDKLSITKIDSFYIYLGRRVSLGGRVHFCTPDDALVVRNILSFIKILSQFVKPPSDTLLP
jgi:hypothetical protein